MVVNPEHHFYGESQPNNNVHYSISEMVAYLSPDMWQGMRTVVILIMSRFYRLRVDAASAQKQHAQI